MYMSSKHADEALRALLVDLGTHTVTDEDVINMRVDIFGKKHIYTTQKAYSEDDVEQFLRKFCRIQRIEFAECHVDLNGRAFDFSKSIKVRDLPNDPAGGLPWFIIYSS
jgi:hypothetical protein